MFLFHSIYYELFCYYHYHYILCKLLSAEHHKLGPRFVTCWTVEVEVKHSLSPNSLTALLSTKYKCGPIRSEKVKNFYNNNFSILMSHFTSHSHRGGFRYWRLGRATPFHLQKEISKSPYFLPQKINFKF